VTVPAVDDEGRRLAEDVLERSTPQPLTGVEIARDQRIPLRDVRHAVRDGRRSGVAKRVVVVGGDGPAPAQVPAVERDHVHAGVQKHRSVGHHRVAGRDPVELVRPVDGRVVARRDAVRYRREFHSLPPPVGQSYASSLPGAASNSPRQPAVAAVPVARNARLEGMSVQ